MQHPDAFYRGCAVAGDQKRCSLVLEGVVLMRRLGIYPIWHGLALAWWKWARKELTSWCPTHPDLPGIVRRINELERGA
jgi:hypothetical protein